MSIRINPFGGSAEIGSNMVTVDDGRDGFIIDCGILFPYDNFYDINYLIPDFSKLNKKSLRMLFLPMGMKIISVQLNIFLNIYQKQKFMLHYLLKN